MMNCVTKKESYISENQLQAIALPDNENPTTKTAAKRSSAEN